MLKGCIHVFPSESFWSNLVLGDFFMLFYEDFDSGDQQANGSTKHFSGRNLKKKHPLAPPSLPPLPVPLSPSPYSCLLSLV